MNETDRARAEGRKRGREAIHDLFQTPLYPVHPSQIAVTPFALEFHHWLCTCLFWELTCSLLSPVPSQWLSCNSIINKHLLNGCFVTEKYHQVSLEKGYRQGLLSEVSREAVVAIAAIQERNVGE